MPTLRPSPNGRLANGNRAARWGLSLLDGSPDTDCLDSRQVTQARTFQQGAPLDTASDLSALFVLLRERTGLDFTLYRPATLRRRIAQRIGLSQSGTLEHYLEQIRDDPEEFAALFDSLLITVSSFFRDPQVFQALRSRVLPKLIQRRLKDGGDLRIWSVGCASGEEAFSLAIIATEAIEKAGAPVRVHVFGTDVSERALAVAHAGNYPATIGRDVSAARRRRFFTKLPDGYRISHDIRSLCTFARKDISSDPPFAHIDLLSCRNVLIYFGPELQRRSLLLFHYALNPAGYLVLGLAEGIADFPELFGRVDLSRKIFVQKPAPSRHDLHWARRFNTP